jgi:hypothetical protein
MKERIEKNLADNIHAAELGERGEDNHVYSYTAISEYHEWRAEVEDFFLKSLEILILNFKNSKLCQKGAMDLN